MNYIQNFGGKSMSTDFNAGYGILLKFIQCFGILKFECKRRWTCVVYFIIPVLLHLDFAEFLFSTFIYMNGDWFDWKIDTAYLICFTIRLTTWYLMRRKSKMVIGLMQKFRYLSSVSTNPRSINAIVIIITFVLIAYPAVITLLASIYYEELEPFIKFVLYGS